MTLLSISSSVAKDAPVSVLVPFDVPVVESSATDQMSMF